MTPDNGGSSTQSPASKAFADKLAKYAYIHKDGGSSRDNGPKLPLKQDRHDGVGEVRRSPRRSSVKTYTDYIEDPTSDGEGPAEAGPSKRKKRKAKVSIKSDSMDISIKEEDENDDDGERVKGKVKKVESGKAKAKKPRGYADPEIYAHLEPVGDLLRPGLDIVFCGINPGKRSSTLGHHFSHPSNKFWKAVHQSGLTSRLLSPLEDGLLLDEFGYGLTNLVDRPTSEQSELSTMEMRLNVYSLLHKFMIQKPLVVCFVGKKIWDVFQGVVQRTAVESTTVLAEGAVWASHSRSSVETKEIKDEMIKEIKNEIDEEVKVDFEIDTPTEREEDIHQVKAELESIDQPSPRPNSKPTFVKDSSAKRRRTASVKVVPIPFDAKEARPFRLRHPNPNPNWDNNDYTYFWVVPNTSGLERTQLPEQVINFTCLRLFVQQLKSNLTSISLPLTEWKDIDPAGVKGTVEDIRRNAIANRRS